MRAALDGTLDEATTMMLVNRRFLYTYLNRAFAVEPDEAFLDVVRGPHASDAFELLGERAHEARRLHRAVVDACACPDDLDRLHDEYTRLFIGPERLPAPPWESVYHTGERVIFQESTLVVREAYRAAGFKAAGYPREADDHVATELSFIAALAERTLDALGIEDAEGVGEAGACVCADGVRALLETQRAFLRDHLLTWIGTFAEALEACENVGAFYPSLASLAALVCAHDVEAIEGFLARV